MMIIELIFPLLLIISMVFGAVYHKMLTRYIQANYPELVKHIIGKDKFPEYWWTSEFMKVAKYASLGDDDNDMKLITYKRRVRYSFRIIWLLFIVNILLTILH